MSAGQGWEDNPDGRPDAAVVDSPVGGQGSPISGHWRTYADGAPDRGPDGRPVPQWTRLGATD